MGKNEVTFDLGSYLILFPVSDSFVPDIRYGVFPILQGTDKIWYRNFQNIIMECAHSLDRGRSKILLALL